MRRVVNSTFISLDGLIEHLDRWHFDFVDDDLTAFVTDQLRASDALLMGRRTYEIYASAWPEQDGEYADMINSVRKYVASATLGQADWANTSVINGDLVEEVTVLKEQPGKDILMHGFGPVAATLLESGLLDELHLMVHPVLAGVGTTSNMLFSEGVHATLKLLGTKTLGSGLVILSYQAI